MDNLTKILLAKYGKPDSDLLKEQLVSKSASGLTNEELSLIGNAILAMRLREELEQQEQVDIQEPVEEVVEKAKSGEKKPQQLIYKVMNHPQLRGANV